MNNVLTTINVTLTIESENLLSPKEVVEGIQYALKNRWAYKYPKTIMAEDQNGKFHIAAEEK